MIRSQDISEKNEAVLAEEAENEDPVAAADPSTPLGQKKLKNTELKMKSLAKEEKKIRQIT